MRMSPQDNAYYCAYICNHFVCWSYITVTFLTIIFFYFFKLKTIHSKKEIKPRALPLFSRNVLFCGLTLLNLQLLSYSDQVLDDNPICLVFLKDVIPFLHLVFTNCFRTLNVLWYWVHLCCFSHVITWLRCG